MIAILLHRRTRLFSLHTQVRCRRALRTSRACPSIATALELTDRVKVQTPLLYIFTPLVRNFAPLWVGKPFKWDKHLINTVWATNPWSYYLSYGSIGDDVVVLLQSQGSLNASHDVTPNPGNPNFRSTRKRKYSDTDPPLSPSQPHTTPKSRASGSAPISSYFQSLKIQKQTDQSKSPSIASSPASPHSINQSVQTELGLDTVRELEELRSKNAELVLSVTHANHLLETRDREIAVLQGRVDRCYVVMKELLLEKCRREKEQAMSRSLTNRIKLGTFSTERQGAHFVGKYFIISMVAI